MSVMTANLKNQQAQGTRRCKQLRRFCVRPLALRASSVVLPLLFAAPSYAQTTPKAAEKQGTEGAASSLIPHPSSLPASSTPIPVTPIPLIDEKGNPLTVPQNVLTVGASAVSLVTSPGVSALETLRGNGGRAGYTLAHNPVVPTSPSVYISGKRLKLNEDYWLDASSGTLFFALPLRAADSISVSYRYLEGDAAQAQRNAAGLQLNLSDATHLNLLYGLNSRQENGANLAMNGLRMDSLFGASGKSSYNGLVYLSDLRAATNTSASWRDLFDPAATKPKSALAPSLPGSAFGSGHILSQSLALQSSGLRVSADFQDVSKQFAGFADLKKGAASDKTALGQLAQMEKEKGLQRLGFGLGLGGVPTNKPANGLTIEWNQIQDKSANDAKKRVSASPFAGTIAGQTAAFDTAKTADKAIADQATAVGKTTPAPESADTLPASRRQSLSLQSGGLGFSLTRRETDAAFKRLADLSDAEKNALALDIRRQFDPNAKVEQVTQADRDQIIREAGLSRETMLGHFQLGKTDREGVFTFGQFSLNAEDKAKGKKPEDSSQKTTQASSLIPHPSSLSGISRQTFGFASPHLQFSLLTQTILSNFKRIGDLSDVEKAQFGKESGLQRDQMSLLWQPDKTTKIGFDKLRIAGAREAIQTAVAKTTADIEAANAKAAAANTSDPNSQAVNSDKDAKTLADARKTAEAATERDTTRIEFKGFKYLANQARTDKAFARAADLALPDADKQQIEKERGFDRSDSTLHFDALKGLTLDRYTYHAANSLDKLTHDIIRDSIAFAPNKKLSFTYAADNDATLAPDPAATSPDGKPITDASNSSLSQNSDGKDSKNPDRKRSGVGHTVMTLKSALPYNFALDWQRDDTKTLDKDTTKQITSAQTLNLGTPKDKIGIGLMYKDKRIAYQDSHYEKLDAKYDNTSEFNIHVKPTNALTLQVGQKLQDRRLDTGDTKAENKLDGQVTTGSIDLDWQAAKNFDVIFGASQTDAPDAPRLAADKLAVTQKLDAAIKQVQDGVAQLESGKPLDTKPAPKKPADFAVPILTDSNTVTLGVKSEPVKNVALAAKFDEIHEEGRNTKDVADFSIGNAKPLQVGVLKDVTVKAGYASLNDKSLLQNETMTGHAEWKMWKHEFLLDYGGFSKLEGTSLTETIARTYSFKTNPDPKLRFHAGYYYKVRTLADGKEKHIRRFIADALLAKSAHFTYTYGTLPEDDKGNIQPLETMELALSHTLRAKTNLSLFYRLNDQVEKGNWTRALGVGVDGQLGGSTKWSLAVSREASGYYGIFRDHAEHARVSLDQQLNSDNFLSVSAEYRLHDGKDGDGNIVKDEVRATLDFSRKF